MVAPFLVHLCQLLELRLKIIHRRVAGLFGRGIEFCVRRRFGKIGGVGDAVIDAVILDTLAHFDFGGGNFL